MPKAKSQKKPHNKQHSLEKEYGKMMRGNLIPTPNPEWSSPNDFFVKFSLYKDISTSIPSNNTSLISQS